MIKKGLPLCCLGSSRRNLRPKKGRTGPTGRSTADDTNPALPHKKEDTLIPIVQGLKSNAGFISATVEIGFP